MARYTGGMPPHQKTPHTIANPLRRNVAIIAHVDHGKTTLVDAMLHQSGIFRANERGRRARRWTTLTSSASAASPSSPRTPRVHYRDVKINIVDTPGHADFGGEVERDPADGRRRAAARGRVAKGRCHRRGSCCARPSNARLHADRRDQQDRSAGRARPQEVLNEVYDLFIDLDATEEQLDFPVLYTERARRHVDDLEAARGPGPAPAVRRHRRITCRRRAAMRDAPLQMLVAEPRLQRLPGHASPSAASSTARVKIGDPGRRLQARRLVCRRRRSRSSSPSRGSRRVDIDDASAGDIVCHRGNRRHHHRRDDRRRRAPHAAAADRNRASTTVSMIFGVNTSPMSGREGQFVTSRQIKDRLDRELLG